MVFALSMSNQKHRITALTPKPPLHRRILQGAAGMPFHWREAMLAVPAIPFLFLAGQWLDQPAYGAVAAGAAFSVGFGAARDLRGRRWGAMLGAMLGMALAGFAGTLIGASLVLSATVAGLLATACAVLALRDEDIWWVMLQSVIALMVAGYYPGGVAQAAERTAAVLAGGIVQIALVVTLAWLVPQASARLPRGPAPKPVERGLVVSHAFRAGLCVALAIATARQLQLNNDYWAPVTALLVLKPGLHDTRARGLERLLGTLSGCVVATVFAVLVADSFAALLVGATVTVGLSYALQKARYPVFNVAVTATVVLFVTIGHGGVVVNAEHRVIATLIGGLIALGVAFLVRRPRRFVRATEDRLGSAS
ncbi:MAG: FUSC family protein [Methylobacterium mesophilicum]|nr:FUSC family protein [Methylobacterium mesophilicum]